MLLINKTRVIQCWGIGANWGVRNEKPAVWSLGSTCTNNFQEARKMRIEGDDGFHDF